MFRPDPPQRLGSGQEQVIIGRPTIPLFAPPQGIDIPGAPPPTVILMAYEDGAIMAYEPDDWFNTLWQKQLEITINVGQVPSAQNDFPLLINDIYPDLIGAVEAELRFTGADNLQLEYEIQEFDTVTGELIVWFNKPSVSDGDVIRIYFDNPGAIDEQNPGAVWAFGYAAVWHLNSLLDSTSNGNDLTNFGSTPTIAGKIGLGRSFNGIDQFLEAADSLSLSINGDTLTLSAWTLSSASDGWIMGKDRVGSNRPYSIRRDSPDLRFGLDTGTPNFLNSSTTLSNVDFNYMVARYDVTQMRVFIDGDTSANTSESGNITEDPVPVDIGSRDGVLRFTGTIDECRISNVARSNDYIKTEYNNQNDPGAFYSTGTVVDLSSLLIAMEYE